MGAPPSAHPERPEFGLVEFKASLPIAHVLVGFMQIGNVLHFVHKGLPELIGAQRRITK